MSDYHTQERMREIGESTSADKQPKSDRERIAELEQKLETAQKWDELEHKEYAKLKEENQRLREALEEIRRLNVSSMPSMLCLERAISIAAKSLENDR